MIGYYCDFGYSDTSSITNISQITFTDINRPITFLEEGDIGQIPNQVMTFEELSNSINTVFGSNQSYLYGVPGRYDDDELQAMSLLPSLRYSAPNLFEYTKGTGRSGHISVIYFKKLKTLATLVFKDGDSGSKAYLVKDDGSLTPQQYSGLFIPYFTYLWVSNKQFTYSFPIYNGGNKEDLSSWKQISVSWRTTDKLGSWSQSSWGTNVRQLSQMFGHSDTQDPDFNYPPPDNPYEPGGPSGPTDPDLPPGTFDDESDPIPDSTLPTISAANTGFTRIYNPTLSQVQALARYLWTDETVIETIWNHIKQFFENPMDAIIGFNLVPVPVPNGGTQNFALMYIDTGVEMTVAANQFVDLDCGTLELKRYYGSALDQSPYTKVSCFLPYIGTVNLNTDEVMGTTLNVKYRVDIVSGSCVAKIFVDGNCLYQYSGHCAITIPFSSADFSSYVSAAISVGKLAAAAITAGAGTAMAAGVAEASQQTNQVVTTTQVTNTARNPSTGRQVTMGTTTTVQTRESPADQSSTQASFSGLSPQNVANTVGAIMSSKPHIEHSGSFSGNSGYLGVRRPFLIIERPNMCMPENYQALNGFPAMITMQLSTCKGFTRVQQVQLTGMGRATNPEQAEILELLKSGVIL